MTRAFNTMPPPDLDNPVNHWRKEIVRLLSERGQARMMEICRAIDMPVARFQQVMDCAWFHRARRGVYELSTTCPPLEGYTRKVLPPMEPRAPELPRVDAPSTPPSIKDYQKIAKGLIKQHGPLFDYDLARLGRIPCGAMKYVLEGGPFVQGEDETWRLK